MNSLEDLGRTVAKHQDQAAERLSEQVVRETLRRARAARPQRSWRWTWALAPAALVIGLLWFGLVRKDAQLAGPPAQQAASAAEPVPSALSASAENGAFVFEDGTTVLLSMGGEGQVVERSDLGGRVRLEQGRMRISVPPDRGRRWEFLAGPYRVEVKGTRFDLSWEPKTKRFDLEMLDGSVRVSGGDVEPRLVIAGQKLQFGAEPEPQVPSPPPPAPSLQAPPSATASAPSSAKPSVGPADQPNWQALALEGKYKLAVEAAESAGFDSVLSRSSASELLLLGDACRLGGKSSLGVRAYSKVRERFAGSLEAQRALFSLGVAAFPSASAATFFEQYLAEAPGGTLAPEALGRLLEIAHRGGNKQAARAAASRYLARFPNGAHARLAKTILDEAAP
jgi:hypothetical protein